MCEHARQGRALPRCEVPWWLSNPQTTLLARNAAFCYVQYMRFVISWNCTYVSSKHDTLGAVSYS
jgi:hypothetical protein